MYNFDYKKTFYQRPIYTQDNIRLWTILSIVAIITILIVSGSLDWVRHFPEQIIIRKIKREYIAFLLEQKYPQKTVETEKTSEPPSISETAQAIPKKRAIHSKRSGRKHTGRGKTRRSPGDILKYVIRPEESSIEAITAAVEKTPGAAALGAIIFRTERPLSFANTEQINERMNSSINIPPPHYERFARHNGKRNLYETIAIMELNEHNIRYCFEKYARYDPTFSGDVVVSFTIHPNGYVIPSSIKIIKTSIHDPRILQCIKRSIQRWRNFPRIALTDGNFTITRKYVF